MTRYLAVPKIDAAVASLNKASVQFNRKARKQQVDALIKLRQQLANERGSRQLDNGLKIAKSAVPDNPILPVTGISFIDADEDQLAQLREAMPDYEIVENVPLDLVKPVNTQSLAAQVLDTWHLEAVQVTRARNAGFKGRGKGVGVAVLDTGIEDVAELKGRIVSAFERDPATGKVKAIPTRDTKGGHGTHVAGIIAGKTVGVAPEANLMNYIMIPDGSGTLQDFVTAIEFIAQRPEISIMNMSAGFRGVVPGMEKAINSVIAVGILPTIAIGNEGRHTSRSPGNYAEVLSIGASTKNDTVANFSSSVTRTVDGQSFPVPDLIAPGENITSCVASGGYEIWSGTSMATPVVAGLAALIVEKYPTISEPDLRGELLDAARFLPGVPPLRQGEGLAQLPNHIWYSSS